jgi:hypothetical protein
MSSVAVDSLWELVRRTPRIDATSLARAVEEAANNAEDYRTRLLIRDSVLAIEKHWGEKRSHDWLADSPRGQQIREICKSISLDAAGEHGFPSLERRIVDVVQPETIHQFLRDLSQHVIKPTRLVIGGSGALMLLGHLTRNTEDIDIVDEIPAEIRAQHALIPQLADRYGLHLAHFQSHYLPTGWETRIHSIGAFGALSVFIVDAYDMFLSKLFSSRTKDRDDLRAVLPHLDRAALETRLRESTGALRGEAKLREAAEKNWYVLFGQPLPG